MIQKGYETGSDGCWHHRFFIIWGNWLKHPDGALTHKVGWDWQHKSGSRMWKGSPSPLWIKEIRNVLEEPGSQVRFLEGSVLLIQEQKEKPSWICAEAWPARHLGWPRPCRTRMPLPAPSQSQWPFTSVHEASWRIRLGNQWGSFKTDSPRENSRRRGLETELKSAICCKKPEKPQNPEREPPGQQRALDVAPSSQRA